MKKKKKEEEVNFITKLILTNYNQIHQKVNFE